MYVYKSIKLVADDYIEAEYNTDINTVNIYYHYNIPHSQKYSYILINCSIHICTSNTIFNNEIYLKYTQQIQELLECFQKNS